MDYNNYHNGNENNDNMNQENPEEQPAQETNPETNGGIAQTARQNAKANQDDKPKKRKSGNFFSALIGGVVSAVIVVLLFTTNIIPDGGNTSNSNAGSNNNESSETSGTPEVTETIASDDANTASSMEEAAEAVVGVTRIQQTNIWEQSSESGTGSGIIYKKENGNAYVVTNQHVVADAQEVEVALNNDERINAEVLGTDQLSDLAVLKIDGSKIDTVASLGSSSDVEVGETAVAIGNPLGMEFANTLTRGIISGVDRSVQMDTNRDGQPDWVTEVLQTDAAINPGNSGGALVNSDGKVIGINSMKIAQTAVEGIGFAIPIDTAMPIIEQLEKDGAVSRPFIGISSVSMSQVPQQYRNQVQVPESVEGGMVIAQAEDGSPAAEAGLQQFDVITKINGNAVTSIVDLRQFLYNEAEIGETVELEIYRNGEAQTVSLELAERQKKQQQN
ncbi:S1C family serine protease [Lentibacillus amyloliquefaciens]|uniref:Serine protease n=1 Tax=Lentibacillus amyloliquefaciens TaxID=1472767 RepID=A0A0U4EF48_9BACI|nr:trypsin-like peptidase domain-containing protein [Lentibacillus amyloliquefaciens]ALX49177.1 serine protease [Lentibacillus amyloliquefaciens]